MFKNLKPHARVVAGRNVTLTAAALWATSRAVSYATMDPSDLNPGQRLVTFDGALLGLWAGVWFMTAAMCIADMVNKHTRYGLAMIVGWATAWGAGYLLVWAFTGFTNTDLISTSVSWIAPAGLVFGFLLKVTALQDMLNQPAPPGSPDDE